MRSDDVVTDYRLCPIDDNADPSETTVPADAKLLAEGWVRRNVTDPSRVEELTEMYMMLGYEIFTRELTKDDFGAVCAQCTDDVCGVYVLIYTRKPKADESQPAR
jgi:hypothetical protein